MNSNPKYIVVEDFGMASHVPFIFPDYIQHSDFAKSIGAEKVIAGGFVSFGNTGEIVPYGESVSLKVKCRKTDKEILNKVCNTQWYMDNCDF
jgi:hypothetical protein